MAKHEWYNALDGDAETGPLGCEIVCRNCGIESTKDTQHTPCEPEHELVGYRVFVNIPENARLAGDPALVEGVVKAVFPNDPIAKEGDPVVQVQVGDTLYSVLQSWVEVIGHVVDYDDFDTERVSPSAGTRDR